MFSKYRCIRQTNSSDCGIACLETICLQNKLSVSTNELIKLTKKDIYGTTIRGIVNAAEKLNFKTKIYNVQNKEDLFKIFDSIAIVKVIIDNKYPHFVVIHKITPKYILIADPASGLIKYKFEDFSKIWTGIIIFFKKSENFRSFKKNNSLVKKYIYMIKPQKVLLINIFFSSIIITIFGVLGAYYFKFILNNVLPNNLESTLNIFSILLVALMIFSEIISAFRRQVLLHFSRNIDITLMLNYYEEIINLPMEFIKLRSVGEIISRLDDAYKIRTAISNVTLTLLIDIFMSIIGGIFLFIQSRYLFVITLIPLVLYILIMGIFKREIGDKNEDSMKKQAELNTELVQCLNGIETIKSFNYENNAFINIEGRSINFINSIFKVGMINNLQEFLKGLVKSIFSIVIIWIGVYQVLKGNLTIGTVISFNALLVYFLNPIVNTVKMQPILQSAIIAMKRLDEIVQAVAEESVSSIHKISNLEFNGDIDFKDVCFRYGNRSMVIKNISINIKNKEKIALVGKSGSGKTTLARLLMYFYEIEKGEILIDKLNIKDIDVTFLRRKIGYIGQETFLFRKTIYENLILGDDNIKYEEVIDACKKAQIHDYINSLPLRYDTLIEENGMNFSGGQKQRLSIARAIIKKPSIIIMDEATSNLDSITEKAISNTMNDFMKDKTAIIIAHRLSTIKNCDRIYVLEQGQVVESGTHEELLNKESYYKKLWRDQMPTIEAPMKVGEK